MTNGFNFFQSNALPNTRHLLVVIEAIYKAVCQTRVTLVFDITAIIRKTRLTTMRSKPDYVEADL